MTSLTNAAADLVLGSPLQNKHQHASHGVFAQITQLYQGNLAH